MKWYFVFIFFLLFLAQLNSHLVEERKIDIYFQGFFPPFFPIIFIFSSVERGMGWGGDDGVAYSNEMRNVFLNGSVIILLTL